VLLENIQNKVKKQLDFTGIDYIKRTIFFETEWIER
jgi:hypothetical protein